MLNIVEAGGNHRGQGAGENFDEPLTYRMKNWYKLIQDLEARLALHYSGALPFSQAGFETVNAQIGNLRYVFTGAQMQVDNYNAAIEARLCRRFFWNIQQDTILPSFQTLQTFSDA